MVPERSACADAVDHEDARQFHGAPPEPNCIATARVSSGTAAAETGDTGRCLVRERDDDHEGDHNKGDRISIKSFPIDVNTHRTALLFAEVAAKTISLGCRRSNSLPAMLKAQQHLGCAARVQSNPHLSKRPTVRRITLVVP
jgi:hypothetical protein